MLDKRRQSARGCLFALTAVTAVLLTGMIAQTVATNTEMAAHPPSGVLVDLGGYRVHLLCTGEGSPTVILFHATGQSIYNWTRIQPETARFTRVCSFDRPGFGWSDPGPAPRSPQHAAQEAYVLLAKAGIGGPYVVVGHSWGSSAAQVFAEAYRDDVRGVVLIDGATVQSAFERCMRETGYQPDVHRPQLACMPPVARSSAGIMLSIQPTLAAVGLLRLTGPIRPYAASYALYDPADLDMVNRFAMQVKDNEASLAEWRDWDLTSGTLGEAGSLGDLPVVLIQSELTYPSAVYGNDAALWRSLDEAALEDAKALSTGVEVIRVLGADHASIVLQADFVQTVTEAIRKLAGSS